MNLPQNVKLLYLPYEKFKEKIMESFPFKVSIENYGRISQFRPALAYIFPEIVKTYDFWGFMECDLIPGNIREFISEDILEKNQKIFKLGHMQMFKNNHFMNTLFKQRALSALSYKYAYKHNILFFEELIGMHNIARAKKVSTYTENVFSDIVCSEYVFKNSKYGYPNIQSKQYIFEYNKGELYRYYIENDEIVKEKTLYVHLQKRNMNIATKDYDSYLIIPNTFIKNFKMDINSFEDIIKKSKEQSNEYNIAMKNKLNADKNKRNKELCWWILRLIRLRIKIFGGVDLSGK